MKLSFPQKALLSALCCAVCAGVLYGAAVFLHARNTLLETNAPAAGP